MRGSGGNVRSVCKFIENHGGNINKIPSSVRTPTRPHEDGADNLPFAALKPTSASLMRTRFLTIATLNSRQTSLWRILFNLSAGVRDKLVDDVRWQYGTPPAGNANFAWLQHMILASRPECVSGMVLANGSLSSQSGGEGEIRKTLSTLTCGLYRRNADAALLHNADSGIALVPCKEQEAERQNAVH